MQRKICEGFVPQCLPNADHLPCLQMPPLPEVFVQWLPAPALPGLCPFSFSTSSHCSLLMLLEHILWACYSLIQHDILNMQPVWYILHESIHRSFS